MAAWAPPNRRGSGRWMLECVAKITESKSDTHNSFNMLVGEHTKILSENNRNLFII